MKINYIFIYFSFLLFFSCTENSDTFTIVSEEPEGTSQINFDPIVENITASVRGFVVDELNNPVEEARVFMGSKETVTDIFGNFVFENQQINARGTVVNIEKEGFFNGSRRFFPAKGIENKIKVQLLDKNFDYSFQSTEGASILTTKGASIDFTSNSISLANGEAYTGLVKIAARWLNPSLVATLDQMPGNLQGVNFSSTEVALASFGMLAVELESPDGLALNLKDENPAVITLPLPEEMQSIAPAEIPLWSYNENYGVWMEESVAFLRNNKYIGEVSHFSFWNCDVPYDLVKFNFQLVDLNFIPLSDVKVAICVDGISFTGTGITSSDGEICALVPANRALTLKAYDQCGNELFRKDLDAISQDSKLEQFIVNDTSVSNTTISGKIVDCNGEDLMNTQMLIQLGNYVTTYYLEESTFEVNLSALCTNSQQIDIIFVDPENLQKVVISSSFINTNNDLGVVTVCGQNLENFVEISVGGETAFYLNPQISTSQNQFTYIEAFIGESYFGVGFEGIESGDYSTRNHIEIITHTEYNWALGGSFDSFIVSQYENITGGIIEGSFEGELINQIDSTATTVEVFGKFHLLR